MGVGAQRGAERALTRSVPTRSNLHTGKARTRGGSRGGRGWKRDRDVCHGASPTGEGP